jgi:hypothetical protein
MEKFKVDEVFGKGQPFATTEALPGETAQSILASFDRPDDLVILQLSQFVYFIYQKSKEEEVEKLIKKALDEIKKEEVAIFQKNEKCFPSLVYDSIKTNH